MFVLVSAIEVLRHANRLGGRETYRWAFVTEDDKGVLGSNGMLLQPTAGVGEALATDMVFVVAGFAAWDLQLPRLGKWIGRNGPGTTLGGISNGGFVLAEHGLLDGYAATVHWEDFSSFYESYPKVNSRYQRFVVDRDRMTCSGGAATLDMFLEIVRRDLGEQIVTRVSRQMLLGENDAHSEVTRTQHYSPQVQSILGLLDAGIAESMTVGRLASKVGISRRELLRTLRRETGQTPSEIINSRRLERARSLVLHSHLPLAAVAAAVGFSSQSHLTLRYRQMYGVTPAQHRRG
jgi:AraC family carnitine catabolism transcriptional activator